MTVPDDERRDRTLELPIQERIVGSAPVTPPTTPILIPRPAPPAAPPRRSMLLVAALATVALIILTFGVIVGFSLRLGTPEAQPPPPPAPPASPQTPSTPQGGPRAVADRFLAAAVTGDQAGVQENLCAFLRDGSGSPREGGGELWWLGTLVGYQVGEERITGPTASVDVELTVPILDPFRFELHLLREGDAWRVCGVGPDTA